MQPLPRDIPLVSVMVRSLGREYLAAALESVAAQSYPSIELVVVAVKPDHPPLAERAGSVEIKAIRSDKPIARSRAANLALDAAGGQYLLFLDDDDWLMPDHIGRLVRQLQASAPARVAYTGVALVDKAGQPIGQVFDMPFDGVRQLAGNLTPIHAVMFDALLRDNGCRFDETLDRYEDWDFWLQLAQRSLFVHLPGVSAVYRIHDSSGVHDIEAQPADRERIYRKWQDLWRPAQLDGIMQRAWAHAELQAQLRDTVRAHGALVDRQRESAAALQSSHARALQTQEEAQRLQTMLAESLAQQTVSLDALQQDHRSLIESTDQQRLAFEKDLQDRTGLTQELHDRLAEAESRTDALQGELRTVSEQLRTERQRGASLTDQVGQLGTDVTALSQQLEQTGAEAADTRMHYLAMTNSKSWRLTRPLRALLMMSHSEKKKT